MAQKIGQVTRKGERFTGFIKTALVKGALEIRPNTAKQNGSKQPDYRIFFDGQDSGAGWFADAKPDMDYRSINCKVDDPSFPAPLRFSLGRAPDQDDDDLFNLIWNRPTTTREYSGGRQSMPAAIPNSSRIETMTKTNEKTASMAVLTRETRMVPLASLYLHPLNPRQSVTDEEIEAMALSVECIGLMQNLLGIEEPGEDGRTIGIVAGGRRLRGLLHMAEAKGIDPTTLDVPVKLARDILEAETWANAENTARAALHPADEIAAYARMIDHGATARLVAKAFAVSERHVQGRLKLAGLAQPVLSALRENRITLEQAGALAICDGHERQAEMSASLERWDRSPSEIRAALTRDATREGTGLARFVTRAEYEAAGGGVREDLFGEDVYFEDGDVLEQLATAKLEALAEQIRVEGWKWVEVIPASLSYESLAAFTRTYGVQAVITEAEEAEYNELAAAIEAESATDEQLARFEGLEARLAEETYSEVQHSVAGAVIGFTYDFEPRIERGLIAKDDVKTAVAVGVVEPRHVQSGSQTAAQPYSGKLTLDLAAIRTSAVQQALLDQPDLALDLLAFALSARIRVGDFPLDIHAKLASNLPAVEDGYEPDARIVGREDGSMANAETIARRFTAFRKKPKVEREAILTEAVARSLGGGLAGKDANPVFEQVAKLTEASVRTVWTPTEAGLFKRLKAAQLDAIWSHLRGKKTADNFYRKKAEKIAYLHRLFNDPAFLAEQDTGTQARVAAWVPQGMEIATVKQPCHNAKPSKGKSKKGTKAHRDEPAIIAA